jgi:hypothetical protein
MAPTKKINTPSATFSPWTAGLAPLVQREQFIRDALEQRGVLEDAYHPELKKVQTENANKLRPMLEQRGFPVLSSAGEEGVRLSWLIIHHAVSLPDFMRTCLDQMRMAAAQDDYPRDLLAYTEDKICFLEGRYQLFGTHFDWAGGELKPTPIGDEKFLNERRKAAGLPPMAESLPRVSHVPPPKDPTKRATELDIWLKEVGWRV